MCSHVCAGAGGVQAVLHCVAAVCLCWVCGCTRFWRTHSALLLAGHRATGDTELLQPQPVRLDDSATFYSISKITEQFSKILQFSKITEHRFA